MNGQDVLTRLQAADTPDALGALGDQLAGEVLEAPAAIVDVWTTGPPAESDKAGFVVLELDELAMRPMLRAAQRSQPDRRFALMRAVVDSQLRLRNRVLGGLDGLLRDRSALPAAAGSLPTEATTPLIRVCDDAYLSARRLVRIEDPERFGLHTEGEFLAMKHDDRSAEIRKWRQTWIWRALLGAEGEGSGV